VLINERGVAFTTHGAFFRPQAVHARDLAVLTALLTRRTGGDSSQLRVLDLLTGAGVRAARYLRHAGAAHVHANDIDSSAVDNATANLAALDVPAASWSVSREESCRLLMRLALEGRTFHVVDVDGFGSRGGVPASLALGCVAFGGVLHMNCTDWALGAAGGAAAEGASLVAAFGARVHACPSAPEQGLRVMLAAVAREAAQRGLRVVPVMSYYAPGPAWRVSVRVYRGASAQQLTHIGYNAHCPACGAAWALRWTDIGDARCACGAAPRLSGPLWHGPLHDPVELVQLAALADELGWSDAPPFEAGTPQAAAVPRRSLRALLAVLQEEADPRLPPFFVRLDDISRAGLVERTPPRDALIQELRHRGHAASRTHCADRALKTSAPWAEVLDAARSITQAAAPPSATDAAAV
jgi:tRNA (guanine26-N2/guanine27-N2)-dimethyltransferase